MICGSSDSEIKQVLDIVHNVIPGAEVSVFGSRITGSFRRISDLDICINAGRPVSPEETSKMKEAFEETDIPYRIDIVDRASVDDNFLKIIKNTEVKIS